MRIGIDARPFKYREFSGIPASVYEILCVWMSTHPEHEYYLISNAEIQLPRDLPKNWHKAVYPAKSGNGTLWMLLSLSGVIHRLKLDAYWGTNYMLPPKVKDCRYLLSVYDLAFVRFPYVSSRKTLLALKFFSKGACHKADAIHVISNSTAQDVVSLYGIRSEKVHTVYLGGPQKMKDVQKVAMPDGVRGRYFLFLSTIEPRKNPVLVLKAYQRFCGKYGTDIQLVFAGKRGWNLEDFDCCLKEHPYRQQICLLGYISPEEKERLLAHAEALLYPSLYEGFGLPILEAMSYGTPVITSRVSSMPEVAGNAAFYIDDIDSAEELCTQMERAMSLEREDHKLLLERMRQNLSRFQWEDCAEQILQLLSKQ